MWKTNIVIVPPPQATVAAKQFTTVVYGILGVETSTGTPPYTLTLHPPPFTARIIRSSFLQVCVVLCCGQWVHSVPQQNQQTLAGLLTEFWLAVPAPPPLPRIAINQHLTGQLPRNPSRLYDNSAML